MRALTIVLWLSAAGLPVLAQDADPRAPRPSVVFTGRVLLENGSAPPERVPIDFVCENSNRRVGYTDATGRFSVDLSRDPHVRAAELPAEDEIRGPLPEIQAMAVCELQAPLNGYRTARARLGIRGSRASQSVGTLVLVPDKSGGGAPLVRASTLMASPQARAAFEKGQAALRTNNLEGAEARFRAAVAAAPRFEEAWDALGIVLDRRGDAPGARSAFEQAIAIDNRYAAPLRHLALRAIREQKWQEAADLSGRAVSVEPPGALDAWFNNAVANFNLKKLETAEKSAREAVRLEGAVGNMPRVHSLLASILAARGDYNGAAANFRRYLECAPQAPDAEAVRAELGRIELKGKLEQAGKTAAQDRVDK
jgi:Flp pilus assembly protein TadD